MDLRAVLPLSRHRTFFFLRTAMNDAIVEKTIDAARLDPNVAEAINRLMLEAWPHIAVQQEGTEDFLMRRWEGYSNSSVQRPLYHLGYRAGELVALAHTFGRTVASEAGEMTLMGLANVCVAKRERGHGLGRRVVEAALARVDRSDFQLSLFQTTPEVAPFYARLGAVTVNNRFCNSLAEDPAANPFWEPVAMRYPATGFWPDSDIDLRGPGF